MKRKIIKEREIVERERDRTWSWNSHRASQCLKKWSIQHQHHKESKALEPSSVTHFFSSKTSLVCSLNCLFFLSLSSLFPFFFFFFFFSISNPKPSPNAQKGPQKTQFSDPKTMKNYPKFIHTSRTTAKKDTIFIADLLLLVAFLERERDISSSLSLSTHTFFFFSFYLLHYMLQEVWKKKIKLKAVFLFDQCSAQNRLVVLFFKFCGFELTAASTEKVLYSRSPADILLR